MARCTPRLPRIQISSGLWRGTSKRGHVTGLRQLRVVLQLDPHAHVHLRERRGARARTKEVSQRSSPETRGWKFSEWLSEPGKVSEEARGTGAHAAREKRRLGG